MAARAGTAKTGQFDRALRELRARILSGDLKADSHVSETAVAEMIGISRTPLRAAIAHLVDEGLLDRAPSGRCTVRPFSRDDIVDAIELRGVLEGTVVRLAAERGADPTHLAECRRILDAIDTALGNDADATDFDAYTRLNAEFHQHLAQLSGSPTMERELARAYRLPLASPNAFLQNQADVPAVRRSLFLAQAQHRAIVEAVEQREGSRAEATAREHARLARANFDHVLFDDRRLAARIPGLALVTKTENTATSHKGRIP